MATPALVHGVCRTLPSELDTPSLSFLPTEAPEAVPLALTNLYCFTTDVLLVQSRMWPLGEERKRSPNQPH